MFKSILSISRDEPKDAYLSQAVPITKESHSQGVLSDVFVANIDDPAVSMVIVTRVGAAPEGAL
jgi:hypothetical protein